MSDTTGAPRGAAARHKHTHTQPVNVQQYPVLRYEDLRGLAEYASGVRDGDTPVWLAAFGRGYIEQVDPSDADTHAAVLVRTLGGDNRNLTRLAWIGQDAEHRVDLLRIRYQGKEVAADSVFWTQSAVEKFLVPYYASVAAARAAEVVRVILEMLGRPCWHAEPGEADLTEYQVFALVHLPQSEYVEGEDPVPGDLAVGIRAADGSGRHRVVHARELVLHPRDRA
jgi:hypothetical protein